MKFLNGFLCYTRQIPSPVCGENYEGVESKTIPDDDICIADVVKRMQRGEIVPLKQLPFGDDSSHDNDIVDDEIDMRNGLSEMVDTAGEKSKGEKPEGVKSEGEKPDDSD